jgi:hypothetical protein
VKKLLFIALCVATLPLYAQYSGGDGDGDIKTAISSKLLDGSAGTTAWFFGGSGDGDIKATVGSKQLDGTTAVLAWFFGGSGDGDIKSSKSSILMNGTAGVTAWFFGGNGDGDIKSRITGSYLGEIEWVGTNSTDWNTTGNWRQTVLPVDGRVKISSSAVNDLHLDQNRTINTLDFNSSGKKVCPGSFNLTVNNGFVGANSSSYVKTTGTGTVKTSISNGGSFAFPVGNTDYNPVTIANNTGSSDNFDVRVLNEVYSSGTSGTLLSDPRVSATWLINKTSGTSNAGNGVDLSFTFDDAQKKNGLSNDNNIRLYHYGSSWVKQSSNGSISKTGTTITYTYPQYKGSFSPFALGDDAVVLPVNWLYFNCQREEINRVNVVWAVTQEQNVSGYTVSRSTDGVIYKDIHSIPAVGNTVGIQQYEHTDPDAPLGTAYYRITQKDLSGEKQVSETCVSTISRAMQVADVEIYPNPTDKQLMITALEPERSFNYNLVDIAGKTIRKGQSIEGRSVVETSDIPTGIYYLHIQGSGMLLNRKVLINH